MLRSEIIDFIEERRFSGKRRCFAWTDEGLQSYIDWAFAKNYMIHVSSENETLGVAIAYPLPKAYNGGIESLLPHDEEIDNEDGAELVVMDWIAANPNARRQLVCKFTKRFPNWENQKKHGIQYGKHKELTNNYINKLKTY